MQTWWINAVIWSGEQFIEAGALAVEDGKISWIGAMADLPKITSDTVHDVKGRLITPGLIDCHTHLVFAGNRAKEFEARLQGISYEAITKAGGGIYSTVNATRQISEEALFEQSAFRLKALMGSGVTTVEIKSGYGLDLETEVKMLKVAKRLGETLPVTVKRTFLGAHTIPPEFKAKREAYVDFLCTEMIPLIAAENLADAVDVFCETIAFTVEEMARIFTTAKQRGLGVKCHAEQLSASGAALCAATFEALSVDHLEYLAEKEVTKLAGTVAVLLPGAYYFLREKQLPPVDALRKANIPIAIASDCNPGTSPLLSMLCVLNMACVLFRLTPEEALRGATQHASRALGLQDTHGTLCVKKQADFVVWEAREVSELSYYMGAPLCYQRIWAGRS